MPYQDVFAQFWEQVKESFKAGQFAKLTMAKSIGKPDLKNIFVRPISSEKDAKVMVKFRYASRDMEDEEKELTLDQTFEIIKSHLLNPFFSVILFTSTKDVMFKINKKKSGNITEHQPTFSNIQFHEKNAT